MNSDKLIKSLQKLQDTFGVKPVVINSRESSFECVVGVSAFDYDGNIVKIGEDKTVKEFVIFCE